MIFAHLGLLDSPKMFVVVIVGVLNLNNVNFNVFLIFNQSKVFVYI